MKNMQKGFTLIELMIVVAIIAILTAIALPAYQDYTIRSKVSGALVQMDAAKLAVTETASSKGELATAVTGPGAAGYSAPSTSYVASIVIADGIITGTTQNTGAPTAPVLVLTPTQSSVSTVINWKCTTTTAAKYVPASCR